MNDDLRTLLRQGDPLPPDETLSPIAVQRMRQAVLAEAPRPGLWRGWRLAAVATTLMSVIFGVYLLTSPRQPFAEQDPVATIASALDASSAGSDQDNVPRDRQIRFMTRGGTRIIWMLKPNSNLTP